MHLGAFEYVHPEVLGVTIWLPALYLCSGPVLGQLSRRVLQLDAPSRAAALAAE